MLKMLLCRTSKVREKLIQEHDIKPIAHVRLLNGQKRQSCTKEVLTGSYYCFSYRAKNSDITGTFLCGTYAAEDFLELIHHPKLKVFDPLVSENVGTRTSNGTNRDGGFNDTWHPTAKQLFNAINLIVICWGQVPGGVLQKIKNEIEKNKNREPLPRQIKAINTIISRDRKDRTLQQMLDDLRKNNNKIRDFHFNLLNESLVSSGIEKSYFE
ncbi:hypothetical protein GNP95_17245 [Paenibacillus woosongensis]|uniref:Uncharacterized protein n=1 Tax=Paenibacillus woosongensis TaxID=307580 RepID=A0A7X3CNW8_9BACL|nr:hypothetical protein [Paenibacillus woosongensis]